MIIPLSPGLVITSLNLLSLGRLDGADAQGRRVALGMLFRTCNSHILHVWNIYLHLGHFGGKMGVNAGKYSIHAAYGIVIQILEKWEEPGKAREESEDLETYRKIQKNLSSCRWTRHGHLMISLAFLVLEL